MYQGEQKMQNSLIGLFLFWCIEPTKDWKKKLKWSRLIFYNLWIYMKVTVDTRKMIPCKKLFFLKLLLFATSYSPKKAFFSIYVLCLSFLTFAFISFSLLKPSFYILFSTSETLDQLDPLSTTGSLNIKR